MPIGNAFLTTVLLTILWVLAALKWILVVWVVLSWIVFFSAQSSFRWRHRGVYSVLVQLNEIFSRIAHPLLRPFRRILPPHRTAGIDWSPMLLLLVIFMVETFIQLAWRVTV